MAERETSSSVETNVREVKGMRGRGHNMGPRPKLKNPMGLFKRLMSYVFRHYRIHFMIVLVCIVISVLASIQGTMFLKKLIDGYITPLLGSESPDFGPLLGAILRVACFYLAGVAASFAQARIMMYVSQGTMRDLRIDVFAHMEKLPIRYFDTHAHGDIMSIYTNDIDTLRQMISQSLPQIFNSVLTVIGTLVSMFMLSIPLTLVSILMVGLMMFCSTRVLAISGRHFVDQQKKLGALNGYIEEMMKGQKVIKVFCHEQESIQTFTELNGELCETARKANVFSNILGPINGQLGNLSYVVCAIVGGALALNGFGGFTLGGLASFLTFNRSFIMPISQISNQFNAIVMALAGADRVFKLLDEEPEADEGYVMLVNARERADGTIEEAGNEHTGVWAWKHYHKAEGTTSYRKLEGDVVFDGVDFGYEPDKQVLFDIKMFATPGQKIAFVGSTGAGKTTITNLINRFYDIQDGKIRYDGININKIKKADLRHSLGMVLQETHLFSGTIMENIRYGKRDATDEEVKAAARLANADGFIMQLADGYNTVIKGDGGSLSQGQRQLLSIARAAIANPPVLILDEATSSIDTRTEKIVQEGMDRLMKGRTTFVIAHRLSTVMNSDCIMVLEQGRIIERGSHEDLLAQKGKYYQLYTGSAIA